MSSDRLNVSSFDTMTTGTNALVETRFIPQRYEPNYPYPLSSCFTREVATNSNSCGRCPR